MVLTKTEEEYEVHDLMKPFNEQREDITPRKIYLNEEEFTQMKEYYTRTQEIPANLKPSKKEAKELGLSQVQLHEYRFLAPRCNNGIHVKEATTKTGSTRLQNATNRAITTTTAS